MSHITLIFIGLLVPLVFAVVGLLSIDWGRRGGL